MIVALVPTFGDVARLRETIVALSNQTIAVDRIVLVGAGGATVDVELARTWSGVVEGFDARQADLGVATELNMALLALGLDDHATVVTAGADEPIGPMFVAEALACLNEPAIGAVVRERRGLSTAGPQTVPLMAFRMDVLRAVAYARAGGRLVGTGAFCQDHLPWGAEIVRALGQLGYASVRRTGGADAPTHLDIQTRFRRSLHGITAAALAAFAPMAHRWLTARPVLGSECRV